MGRELFILQKQLEEYAARGLYPLHMPGHKRRMAPAPDLPFSWDMTEVPGTDDLHDARGILREAMDRTARLYGAERTWYLVNGSTCGLLAGVRVLAPRGSEVLCARNCHKAVYHALELSGYRVHWLMPEVDPVWGICGGIGAEQVMKSLRRHPFVRAVILTSPTYEGILSEVEDIARICHVREIPLLVDEAHGAHLLPLSEEAGFPRGAVACGADLVVQSPHKTLPSLTQTALLHLQGGRVRADRIEEELDIFETSSPSYPLMASLDGCTGILREEGARLFSTWAERLQRFAAAVRDLQYIRILHYTELPPEKAGEGPGEEPGKGLPTALPGMPSGKNAGKPGEESGKGLHTALPGMPPGKNAGEPGREPGPGIWQAFDPGKILIHAGATGRSGKETARVLREMYGFETEMVRGSTVLAMTSPCDDEDALDRLAAALLKMDEPVTEEKTKNTVNTPKNPDGSLSEFCKLQPRAFCTLHEAAAEETEEVPLRAAAGRVCGEYLYFYPPGIPFLAPGEIITGKAVDLLIGAAGEDLFPWRHRLECECEDDDTGDAARLFPRLQRAEKVERRAEEKEQRTEKKEHRAEEKEQRTENRERKAGEKEQRAEKKGRGNPLPQNMRIRVLRE